MYGNVRVASSVRGQPGPLISFGPRLKLGPSAPGRSELRCGKVPPSGSRRIGLFTGFLNIGLIDLCLAQWFTGRCVDDRVLFVTSFVRPLWYERCRVIFVCHPGLQLKTDQHGACTVPEMKRLLTKSRSRMCFSAATPVMPGEPLSAAAHVVTGTPALAGPAPRAEDGSSVPDRSSTGTSRRCREHQTCAP